MTKRRGILPKIFSKHPKDSLVPQSSTVNNRLHRREDSTTLQLHPGTHATVGKRRGRPPRSKPPDRNVKTFVTIFPREQADDNEVVFPTGPYFHASSSEKLFPSPSFLDTNLTPSNHPFTTMSEYSAGTSSGYTDPNNFFAIFGAMSGRDVGFGSGAPGSDNFWPTFPNYQYPLPPPGASHTGVGPSASIGDYATPFAVPQITRLRRKRHDDHNEYINDGVKRMNEHITTSTILHQSNAKVELPAILLSKLFRFSYIWEETVRLLGYGPVKFQPHRSINPRGGVFDSIGVFRVYVWANASDSPVLVDLQVLPGSPLSSGVMVIFGKPEIEQMYGHDWTPERHIEQNFTMDKVTPGPVFDYEDVAMTDGNNQLNLTPQQNVGHQQPENLGFADTFGF
ncbi:hypothetical protein B0H63DRAFT_524059 [Podospora didyma]|uniref:Uncharacterized protein n=1 Tax=Podospora didyma TaxID=330526 RepID=A0AAE0NGW0_9PEZI|nr:hypothetical protein B0H63DRAFT_524059 [Podospora didyma]